MTLTKNYLWHLFHGAMTAIHETQCTKHLTVLRVKDKKQQQHYKSIT